MTYDFDVPGIPQQKGSTSAFARGTRIVTTSANKHLKAWETTVGWMAKAVGRGLLLPPIALDVEFRMPGVGAGPLHTKVPDLDKLIRGVCDPMSGILYLDDKHIARVTAVKRYCQPGERPGARVRVSRVLESI